MAKVGFFTKQLVSIDGEPVVKKEPGQRKAKQPKAARSLDCAGCGLDKHCQSPRMEATGRGARGILVIGEAPGEQEDARGEQFVGPAGDTIRRVLEKQGFDWFEDIVRINAVNCRPFEVKDGREKNRAPEYFEVECCRQRVWQVITDFKPKLILLLGASAVESFLGHRWQGSLDGISKWRGWTIPDREVNAWVCPTFHPSYVNRARRYEPVVEVIWEQDLIKALALVDTPLPVWRDEHKCVNILPARLAADKSALGQVVLTAAEEDEIISAIQLYTTTPSLFYLDFECNSRKPYLPGRKILTCAVSISDNEALSFPVTLRIAAQLAEILDDEGIPKAAQNMKFEDAWANTTMLGEGQVVKGWEWDSMLAANVLDNRTGVTGLKFQIYVNFGLIDYASHLAGFMDVDINQYDGSDDDKANKDANAINKLELAPTADVLMYGGIDALCGRRLSIIQMPKIEANANLLRAYNLFHAGTITLAGMEQAGMLVDLKYIESQYKHIMERRIPAMERAMAASDVIVKWKEKYGKKFNMGSDEQLGDIIVNVLGIQLPETAGSNKDKRRYSTAAAALEEIEDEAPFVTDIVSIERLKKVAGTSLKGLMREAPDGVLHTFFNLGGDAEGNHVVTSYRGSSSSINFQNQPIRNPESAKIVRQAFIPRPGMQRLSADFKGIEVSTSCCVHKDSNMIRYQTDKTTNMHRDMAMQLMMLEMNEWTKDCRDVAKNKFVFPEFYGSYWYQTAADIWSQLRRRKIKTQAGLLVADHLAVKGITEYRCKNCEQVEAWNNNKANKKKKHRKDHGCCFENHVRLVENDFWHVRFAEYTEWKERHMREYEKTGQFYLLTGFLITGVLRKNQILNLPIQGPAFHCLLFTLDRIFNRNYGIAYREDWESLAVGQIHDSGEMDVVPGERDHIIKTFNSVVAEDLPEAFPWTRVVPFEVEFSITPVDGSWYTTREIKS